LVQSSAGGLDPLLREGIAHLWLVTLHPFDDGNGRVTRAVTDLALAQAERQSIRFYSLNAAIMARRPAYYEHLERTQKGEMDHGLAGVVSVGVGRGVGTGAESHRAGADQSPVLATARTDRVE